MKETADTLKEFLNDFIGHVVPGAVVLGALFAIFEWPFDVASDFASSLTFLVLTIAVCYGSGHVMSALHGALLPALERVGLAVDEAAWETSLETNGQADRARQAIGSPSSSKGRALRSELMTLSPQARELAVRFQHLALLYTGIAMALWIAVCCRLYAFFFSPELLRIVSSNLNLTVQSAAVLFVGGAALWKAKEFHARSLRVPFSAGTAEINERNRHSTK
jgi:hypothetical protein